ncbi:MAG TPA: hypothetical protein VG387_10215 [Rhizomicrobium sp.]|jgi:hypothetical protein|nr:hypothetical protein [Rhizomicrobium sp.]
MSFKIYALGGAAAVALAMLSPAQAFTFHPATPAEIKQTDDLNAQALATARGNGTTTDASFSGGMNTGMSTNATMPRQPSDTSMPSDKTKTKAKMDQQPGAKPAQTDDNSVTPAPTNQ